MAELRTAPGYEIFCFLSFCVCAFFLLMHYFFLPFTIIIALKLVYFVFFQLSLGIDMQRDFFKITC